MGGMGDLGILGVMGVMGVMGILGGLGRFGKIWKDGEGEDKDNASRYEGGKAGVYREALFMSGGVSRGDRPPLQGWN